MKNDFIAVVVICLFSIISALFFNLVRQHYVCEYPWSECRPTEMIICEPVHQIETERHDLEERAKEAPWPKER